MDETAVADGQMRLMELCTGFWSFKTLAAAVELGLFTHLADRGERTARELADDLELAERPAGALVTACTALGFLDKAGDRYRNSTLADQLLVAGRPDYFGGMVTFSDQWLYPSWGRVVEALRRNRPTSWDPDEHQSHFTSGHPVIMQSFWEAMHGMSLSTARALAATYDFGRHSRLLDVGAGSGAFCIELCRAFPHLTATAFDLPHVADIAAAKVVAAGLGDRIAAVGGDFLADAPLPGGHDVILLSMILHDWDEATGRALLDKCRAALPDGGVVLVCELILDDDGTGPPAAALMGMTMVIETTGGRNYAEGEYVAWLRDAGFAEVTVLPFTAVGANGVVVGRAT